MTATRREQLRAAAGAYLADALDAARLLERQGLVPDAWQAAALRSTATRRAMLVARQGGKSTVLVATALHVAAYIPGSTVGILAPTLRQSCLLLRRVRRALPAVHVEATNHAATVLELTNGSRLVAWPGSRPDLIRGDVLDLLVVDEGAWVPDAAFEVALPMLAMSGGSAVVASTPGGPTGMMHSLFQDPGGSWELTTVPADQITRYAPEALDQLRRDLGETAFAVEFLCEWREGSDAVFTSREIAALLGLQDVPDALPGEAPLPDDLDIPTTTRAFTRTRLADRLAALAAAEEE